MSDSDTSETREGESGRESPTEEERLTRMLPNKENTVHKEGELLIENFPFWVARNLFVSNFLNLYYFNYQRIISLYS